MRRAIQRWWLALPILGLPLWALAPAPAGAGTARTAQAAAGEPAVARVIVKYRATSALMTSRATAMRVAADGRVLPQHAGQLGRRLGLTLSDGHVLGARTQSVRAAGLSSSVLAERLAAQADVEWAVPALPRRAAGVIPNDPLYGNAPANTTPAVGQWYLRPYDASAPAAINAEGAWAITTGSPSVTVAVLDTGVRFDHPDLVNKLWPGYDLVSRASTSLDNNGPDSDATDPGTNLDGSCGTGSDWHGTQVASLVAADTDNGIGMAGAGRNVKVLPVRVLGRCGIGYDDDIIAGMRFAANLSSSNTANPHPAKVINLSLGGRGDCASTTGTAYREVLAELAVAGVTVVVAAGNTDQPFQDQQVLMPGNCSGVIAVAAIRHVGTKVGFSRLGPEVAISAPGGNCVNTSGACLYPLITATNTGTLGPLVSSYTTSFQYDVGTSFSAPLVSGTVGLMLSVNPALTPARIRQALTASARPFPTTGALTAGTAACRAPDAVEQVECYCNTSTCGAGMLDAAAAVVAAQTAGMLSARGPTASRS
mgnify:CR=1 FL=1